jgi:hypothetical protein
MSDKNKIDTSTVYEMFETINRKLDKLPIDKPVESAQNDLSALNIVAERFKNVIEEARKPVKVEHQHRYSINIASSKVFLSLLIMLFLIVGLLITIGEQVKNKSRYWDNDLKYRYIKMQGQTNEANLYRLEQLFRNSDSIKIIRKQVEKYEDLVKAQAERIERAKQNSREVEQIKKEPESLRERK